MEIAADLICETARKKSAQSTVADQNSVGEMRCATRGRFSKDKTSYSWNVMLLLPINEALFKMFSGIAAGNTKRLPQLAANRVVE